MPRGYIAGSSCDLCGRALGVRNKFGRCIRCRTDAFTRAIRYNHEPSPAVMERIRYYQRRAALGLPLFAESPWARLPGAHNRLGERQMKLAIATCTVTFTDKREKASE